MAQSRIGHDQDPVLDDPLEDAVDAYVAVDAEGRVIGWNRAAAAVFGWPGDEALGRNLDELVGVPDADASRLTDGVGFDRLRAPDEPPVTGRVAELTVRRRSGETFDAEVSAWASGGGAVTHALVRDVTERSRASEQMHQSIEDLQAFAAMAAHDLRSPLAVISSYAELVSEEIEDGSLDPVLAADRMHRIRRAADRGVALIEDLLAYAAIGRDSLVTGSVDLTLLAQTVAAEQQAAADRRVSVSVAALPEIEGSLPLLRQLLSNLVANAVKYGPRDRPVRIHLDAVGSRSEDLVVVRVTDNGDPIPPADRERLFGIFERGDHADIPGTGVGLAICQRVAEAHGGRVWLDPDHDAGNRFCVELATAR